MKRLMIMTIILTMLGFAASSNAYILVYNTTSTIKALSTDVNAMVNKKVSGMLALDINDTLEIVDDARMVIYGKDIDANKVYFIEDFHGAPRVDWTVHGDYVTVLILNHRVITGNYNFEYDYRFTGKIRDKDVGFGPQDVNLRTAATSLKGSMICTDGSFFDANQVLFGSGSSTMTLDLKTTRAANATPLILDQIVINFTQGLKGLEDKGYLEFLP